MKPNPLTPSPLKPSPLQPKLLPPRKQSVPMNRRAPRMPRLTAGEAPKPKLMTRGNAHPEEQILAAIKGRLPLPNGTPRAIKTRTENAKKKQPEEAEAKTDDGKVAPCADKPPRAETEAQAEDAAGESETAVAEAEAAPKRPPLTNASRQCDGAIR